MEFVDVNSPDSDKTIQLTFLVLQHDYTFTA